MKLKRIIPALFAVFFTLPAFSPLGAFEPLRYPTPPKGETTDDYFGTKVADPYRWMEEGDSPELAKWIEAENNVTSEYLSKIPFRNKLRDELTARFDYPKHSLPFKEAGHYFYFKNTGLQNQSVLYVTDDLSKEPRTLLDPNALSDDGTVALSSLAVSKDGKYLAYTVSKSGSDWQEGFLLDVATGKTLGDRLEWIKFSDLAWAGDGFYYSRYPEPEKGKELSGKNEFHQIWFHRVGTAQSDDELVFVNRDEPLRNCSATTDEDENYLFLMETESTYGNTLLFRDLRKSGQKEFTPIFPDFSAETYPVDVRDGKFLLLTDYKAPRRRLVAVDIADPTPNAWRDLIPESDDLLVSVEVTGDRLAATYLKDAAHEIVFFDFDGKKLGELKLPTLGVSSISGKKGDDELFYSFTSFVYPTVVFRTTVSGGETTELFGAPETIRPDDYTTERVWYTSRDGTRAPMFLTYKKGIPRDGSNPTLLYGYGGFNINMTPTFKPDRTVFLDHGGVLAVAVLRGGGEYGETWHKAGTKQQKQNVFDDFIAAAEYLIAEKYTSPEHLAIHGGSNGGLLVGAAMTQRPELFGAAVPAVGVLDMLRYHLFTIGWAWAVDYGTSEESAEMFRYLYGYSPLHQIKPGVKYPATLITTSDHDDRVVPAHSFKFAATLQAAAAPETPILIRIETKAGHGRGKPLSKVIDEAADMYAFILYNTK